MPAIPEMIPGSTADIWKVLYKNLHKIEHAPNDKALANAILLDADMAKIHSLMTDPITKAMPDRANKTIDKIDISIKKSRFKTDFEGDFKALKGNLGVLNEDREALTKEYQQLKEEEYKLIKDLFSEKSQKTMEE